MKAFHVLIMAFLLSNTFSLLTKYGIEETTNGGVLFDSNDFDDGDKMYFKVDLKRSDYNSLDIYYFYVDNIVDIVSVAGSINRLSGNLYHTGYTKTSYYTEGSTEYMTRHFTIKKKDSEYGLSTTGRYLFILLPVDLGKWARVENLEEDGGKLPTWAIVLIIVVVVLIFICVIIYWCYRRKKMQAMSQRNAAANAVAVTTAANIAAQQNLQAQVYQAQAYQAQAQAYQAQAQMNQQLQAQAQAQAYQAQMNGPQTYPQQNYQTPINSNDVGYSSKAVM